MKEAMYESLVDSRTAEVALRAENFDTVTADIAIVCREGKYGLIHIRKNDAEREESFVLPCRYDNLFFSGIWLNTFITAVSSGRQGMFCLSAVGSGDQWTLEAESLLPCEYDRIEQSHPWLLLYSGRERRIFDPEERKLGPVCSHIERLSGSCYFCESAEGSFLWNAERSEIWYRLEEGWDCSFSGMYQNGMVFRLQRSGLEGVMGERLLFSDRFGEGCLLSPEAYRIALTYTDEGCGSRLTDVNMSWSGKGPLSYGDILKICSGEE